MSNEQKGLQLNANGEIVLTFYEDFTKETCKKFMEELIAVEQVVIEQNAVNKQLAKEAQQPIPILHIKLNSYGGSMWDCFSLMNQIDLLKEYGVTVIMEAMGYICSAGFMLFLKGDVRLVTSDQVFILYHYPLTTYLHENIYRVEDDLRMTMKHFEYIENLIVKETKITKEMLEKYRREDWIMDLELARELEVVNDVKIMKDYEEKMKLERQKNDLHATLEKKIVALSISTHFSFQEIYDMTIRKFTMALTTVDDLINYKIMKTASMSGFVQWPKDHPIEHWFYKPDKDMFGEIKPLYNGGKHE